MEETSIIGHFGPYGGRFVPEALIQALDELDSAHKAALNDPEFQHELEALHRTYTGRPSIITEERDCLVKYTDSKCIKWSCLF